MQIWLHTKTPETGDALGFVEVRPNSAALELIAGGFADPINKGSLTKLAPEAKWDGTSALVLAFDSPPSVEEPPVISGHNAPGSVLECTPGSYFGHPIPVITRQWLRDGADIVGETGLEYTVAAGDHDASISIRETVANEFGFVDAVSNVITIIPADFTPTGWLTTGQDANGNVGMGSNMPGGSFTGNLAGMSVPSIFYTPATVDSIFLGVAGTVPTGETILTLELNGEIVYTSDPIPVSAWDFPGFVSIVANGFKFIAGRVYGCSLTPAAPPKPGTGELTAGAGTTFGFTLTGFAAQELVTAGSVDAAFGDGSGTFSGEPVIGAFTYDTLGFWYIYTSPGLVSPTQLNARIFDSSGAIVFEGLGQWNAGPPGVVLFTSSFKFVVGETYYFESY